MPRPLKEKDYMNELANYQDSSSKQSYNNIAICDAKRSKGFHRVLSKPSRVPKSLGPE
jgi:hypothetical protein